MNSWVRNVVYNNLRDLTRAHMSVDETIRDYEERTKVDGSARELMSAHENISEHMRADESAILLMTIYGSCESS